MALPVYPNAISLSAVNVELSYPSTQTITLNDAAVRSLFVKASGAIAMSDGHGKSAYAADINSHTWPNADASYELNGYRTLFKYHAAGGYSTTSFTLTNSATVEVLLMDGGASAGDAGDNGGCCNCCVCDGNDNRDFGGHGGGGGRGGQVYVGSANITGGTPYSIVLDTGQYPNFLFHPTTAFGLTSANGTYSGGSGGEGKHVDFDENCDTNETPASCGSASNGYTETWTGQSLQFGASGTGGCGGEDGGGGGGQGSSAGGGSGYGAGGGGGGGGGAYQTSGLAGSGIPNSATAGAAILIRYRYRPE